MSKTVVRILTWLAVALGVLFVGGVALLWVALQGATFG